MESFIAPTATVDPSVRMGMMCIVEEDVTVGPGCLIGHRVILRKGTKIGGNVRIDDGTVIGKTPMKAANSATTSDQELPPTLIGENCIIGTNVVIYRGATLGNKVLVADLSTVRENVSIGDFTIVGRGVAIENFCTIGRYVKLETNVYVTAYTEVGDRVFIAPGVCMSNDNFIGRTEERFKHFKGATIKRGARIGVQATLLPGVTIAEDTLVAAGSVVTKDTQPGMIHLGSPAKAWRPVPKEQLLENQGWEDK